MEELKVLQSKLKAQLPDLELREQEPRRLHTTFRVGGPASLMALPRREADLGQLLRMAFQAGVTPFFLEMCIRDSHMIMSLVTGVKNWAANLDMTNWTEQQINSTIVMNPGIVALLVVGMLLLIIFIVFITNSERKVPVQYAKRVVGRKMYGGQSTHIPIKVNLSGVLPIIFAQSIAMIPATIGMFVPSSQQEGSAWHTFLSVFKMCIRDRGGTLRGRFRRRTQ